MAIQPYINDAHSYLNSALDFAHQGFMSANVVLGLLIAVVAAFTLSKYTPKAIIATTIGATLLFIVAQILVPVIDHNAQLKLPDVMIQSFWRELGLLAVGLFIVISVLYVLKKTVIKGGGGH